MEDTGKDQSQEHLGDVLPTTFMNLFFWGG